MRSVLQEDIMGIMREALLVAIKLAGPMLLVSLAVGLLIAIFQAATQIHEQTLTFIPKVILIAVMLLVLASWMIVTMEDFINRLITLIYSVV